MGDKVKVIHPQATQSKWTNWYNTNKLTQLKMMNRKLSTLMLAAAALLASCSQDDALQSTENTNEGLKPMTITASLPTDGMQTRAEGDDSGDAPATRCYMQILNDDGTELDDGNSKPILMDPNGKSFTTTVYLNGNKIYNFLFWADTEATDAAAPEDLRAVEYTNGQTIAWAENALDVMWNAGGVDVTLSHVVSRVTVMTKSGFTVSETCPLTVTVPAVFSTYNVETEEVIGQAEGYTFNADPANYVANTEVAHFYVLGDGNTQKLGLHYEGPLENPPIEINNVPVSANTHITLTGDICNVGLVSGVITTTVSKDWQYSSNKPF